VCSPLEGRHGCYVLLEFGSSDADADLNALMEKVLGDALEDMVIEDAVIAQSGAQADGLWKIREAIPQAQKKEGGSIKHDVAVPASKTPEMIDRATELVEKLIPGVHVGGIRPCGPRQHPSQPHPARKRRRKPTFLSHWRAVNEQVHDLVVAMGGSFSAEHGVGQRKTGEMARFKSEVELDLMRTLKNALDPQNLLNPGKVLPPQK